MGVTKRKRVFLADDSLFFRMRLSEILTDGGHEVVAARNGKELIDNIVNDTEGIDLLVLDLHMPDMDGFEVLGWIKENGYKKKFPVLVVTGVYDPLEVMGKLRDMGVARLISKAYTPEHINFMVNNVLYSDLAAAGQKRARVPVSIPVDFTVGDRSYSGFILNISDNGVFLHTKEELLTGSLLHLSFSLPESDKVIKIHGIVRWSTGEKEAGNLFSGSGIMFSEIEPEDQDLIIDFVKEQAERFGLD
jgi:uncharacterized protein (TIGR02266 family)